MNHYDRLRDAARTLLNSLENITPLDDGSINAEAWPQEEIDALDAAMKEAKP